jgi:phosphoribosylformylglycinamidine synthase PurS subunit
MTLVVVTVMPKKGVLDPQGQAVQGALQHMGFSEVADVRVGKRIELEIGGHDPAAQATKMCEDLLANNLIEDYSVEVPG